ncbi:MAG: BamA/TamA family outer membrane protein [Bacteroidota bacterium]
MHSFYKPVNVYLFILITGLAAAMSGCVVLPHKYHKEKPFVSATNINIQGNQPPSEKADLKIKLQNQLDDSMKALLKTVYPGRIQIINPSIFDTAAAHRSIIFMNDLMRSEGYYKADITWDTSMTINHRSWWLHNLFRRTSKDWPKTTEQRISVDFTVIPGKSYKFDSIAYRLQDSGLQKLTMSRRGGSLLKKGDPFSVEIVAAEMDRLVELFRNNGYYKFSRDDLTAERDTVFSALINPSLDPFEQLRLLQQAKSRRNNPVMNVVVSLRNPAAVNHFRKYYIRNVNIYPDLDLLEDSSIVKLDSVTVNGIHIFNKYNKFKPSFIASKSILRPGDLFRLRNSVQTYSNFTQLNTFTQVTVEMQELKDSSAKIDVLIRMYPSVKQDVSVTADASYNTGDIIATGDLFGVGLNLGLNNRNVAKQAIQSSTNLRTGVEVNLGTNFIQTLQTSLSHNYSFPRLILPKFILNKIKTDSLRVQRTLLNFNGAYTDRKDFYQLRSLNASFGYQLSKGRRIRRNHTWYYSPLNVEYVLLNPRDTLINLLNNVPNLKFSFNTGLVISQILGYNYLHTAADGAKKNELRVGLEESGGLTGFLKALDRDANLYRFVKIDADFKHYVNWKKSALVFRLYGGIGIPYGKDKNGDTEKQLPFFKSFYAGGPYSMRAWQVRQLGIGSSKYFDTASAAKGIDRFGDIQLEGNIEYRFNLGLLFGVVKMKSALFSDIGNIWYRTNYGDPNYKGAEFNINKLYTDIAVGAGTSLRADFDIFLIRFDWSYKLKNPAYSDINYGWFHDLELLKGQFQLGINYPF